MPAGEAFDNHLVIRCPDRVVVREDGCEAAFKGGANAEADI